MIALILSWLITALGGYWSVWLISGVSLTLRQLTGAWLLIVLYKLLIQQRQSKGV